jgi:hypothetical protein
VRVRALQNQERSVTLSPGRVISSPAMDHAHCTQFVCPFCRKECEAHDHGDGEGDVFVIHIEPTCQRFDELEPDEFLHQVNVQYGMHN